MIGCSHVTLSTLRCQRCYRLVMSWSSVLPCCAFTCQIIQRFTALFSYCYGGYILLTFYHPGQICRTLNQFVSKLGSHANTIYSQLFSHLCEARLLVSLARSGNTACDIPTEVVARTVTSSQCQSKMGKCRFSPLRLNDSTYNSACTR